MPPVRGGTLHNLRSNKSERPYIHLVQALYFCAQQQGKGCRVYVPGDSISMISEVISVLPSTQVTIYKTPSMNESHRKHCEFVRKEFGIGWLAIDGVLEKATQKTGQNRYVNPADQIADVAVAHILQRE